MNEAQKPTMGTRPALALMTTIFFMWGFITVLNDVLIPHLKALFTLNYFQAMLVQFIFFGAYFVVSLPAGRVLARLGYRMSVALGLAVAGLGALAFVPAAKLLSYELFLFGLFVLASGITLLQVAANPYVSLLGPARYASSRLNLAQALNSLGTTLAPKVGGMLILSGAALGAVEIARMPDAQRLAYRLAQADLVRGPYLALAGTLFVLAAIVAACRLPALAETIAGPRRHTLADALRHRHVRLAVVAIFLYVGAEVSIGSFMISYLSMPGIGAISENAASGYVSLYWGGAMVGRFVGFALSRRFDPARLLGVAAAVAVALLATTILSHGKVAMWSVVAIGLFNSVMFPTIFTLGIARLGDLTDKASSLLVMAIVGGAIVPLAQGALADRIGVQPAFVLPLACYAFIVYYGFFGARVANGLAEATAPAIATVRH